VPTLAKAQAFIPQHALTLAQNHCPVFMSTAARGPWP